MTDDERDKRFASERKKRAARLAKIAGETSKEIKRLLRSADRDLASILAGMPSDFQAFQLPVIQQSIRRTLAELGDDMAASAAAGAESGWRAGVDLVDAPIQAGGVAIKGWLPEIDRTQLMAMRSFLTDRLKDVAADATNKINGELGMVLIGAKSPSDAVSAVSGILGDGSRGRALTITRTEIGRAFSVASQQRYEQAREVMPGLKKQWRRSGKLHSRLSHDLADGQIVGTDKPFMVGGEALRFPRDPKGSAKNTINCGCVSLPFMSHWEVKNPRERPFTKNELDKSEAKRRIAQVQASAFDRWVKGIGARKVNAQGNFETVGGLSEPVANFLKPRGIETVTQEIAVSDRRIQHMLRDAKTKRGAALPVREVRRIPDHLSRPKAVLLDSGGKTEMPSLIYVFDVPGHPSSLGKLVVHLRRADKRAKLRNHNWLATGGLVDKTSLTDERFELITGSL